VVLSEFEFGVSVSLWFNTRFRAISPVGIPMHFDVLTIFPQLFEPFRTVGVLGKAVERGVIGSPRSPRLGRQQVAADR
jgi:hypothetical protein